jgi:glycosyltransferase involved in cell wall biosynthesis
MKTDLGTNHEPLLSKSLVVTFRTGGSPETVDERTGIVVEKGNSEGLLDAIESFKSRGKKTFFENCIRRSLESFNSDDRFRDYLEWSSTGS